MSADNNPPSTSGLRIMRLTSMHYQLATARAPVTGTATIDFGDAAIVEVDALDHQHLISLHVDTTGDIGRAVAEAWFGDTASALRVGGDLTTVRVVAGPVAEAIGQAAICDLFADIDHPLQTGLWLGQELLSLARAEANDPRLRIERNDLMEPATEALEMVVGRLPGWDDLALVHDAAQILLRSQPREDLAARLDALRSRTGAMSDSVRLGRGEVSERLALTLGHRDARLDRPPRQRLDILPVIAQLSFRREVRFGPRSQVLIERRGSEATVTITDVVAFPTQDGQSPIRVHLRARAAGPDDIARHVDQVRLRYDADTATATAQLRLDDVMVGRARFVILDIPGNDPPPSPSEFGAAIVRCEAQVARLLAELPTRHNEVERHWDNAIDASLLMPDGAQRLVFEAQLKARRTRTQLTFATLALRVRLDVPHI